jgi:sugar transferase (PEP-CTERM/EpsH1 system associated)
MLEGGHSSDGEKPKRDMLFLTQRIPYPPVKGEKIRPLQILKHFAKSYNVYLGCHIKAIATGRALSVALYNHKGLRQWVERTIKEVRPDVVFVCSSNMAGYVLDQPTKGRICIVDLADVDSEKWRSYASNASGFMRWIYRREARMVLSLERRIAHEADFSTFVSESEAALFRTFVPDRARTIIGVSSGIDHGYFDPAKTYQPPYDERLPSFVFTGTMDYIPNVDAVCWFAAEIFPAIRHSIPSAQFYIVGANPAPAVRELAAHLGIHVTGRVPDVRPYLAGATAVVAPMRIARGIQNKVMEGMSMAKPVIVTSDALEGIDAAVGAELLLADDASSFAAAACLLAENPEQGALIGKAARSRMVSHFSWEAQLRRFDSLLTGS